LKIRKIILIFNKTKEMNRIGKKNKINKMKIKKILNSKTNNWNKRVKIKKMEINKENNKVKINKKQNSKKTINFNKMNPD
jgi:hypothetical protein